RNRPWNLRGPNSSSFVWRWRRCEREHLTFSRSDPRHSWNMGCQNERVLIGRRRVVDCLANNTAQVTRFSFLAIDAFYDPHAVWPSCESICPGKAGSETAPIQFCLVSVRGRYGRVHSQISFRDETLDIARRLQALLGPPQFAAIRQVVSPGSV